MVSVSEPLPGVGAVVAGKYRLVRPLGEGGMGVVFAADHLLLGTKVALKLLRPEVAQRPEAVARFMNEGRAAARLQSEHVARLLDIGTMDSGLPYIVLELLEGLDLSQLIEAGPVSIPLAVDYVLQACEAVAEAHSIGIVHRDLKPANLFLAQRRDRPSLVKVLDFGISKLMDTGDAKNTSTHAILGTPCYMSPEQFREARKVDARSDIWSLGVVLYELLTGRLPYRGGTIIDLFEQIRETTPARAHDLRPEIPFALSEVVARCIQREPEARYGHVLELARALTPFGRENLESLERITHLVTQSSPRMLISPPTASSDPAIALVATNPGGTAQLENTEFSGPSVKAAKAASRARPLAVLAVAIAVAVGGLFVGLTRTTKPPAVPAAGIVTDSPAPSAAVATPVAPVTSMAAPSASLVPVTPVAPVAAVMTTSPSSSKPSPSVASVASSPARTATAFAPSPSSKPSRPPKASPASPGPSSDPIFNRF